MSEEFNSRSALARDAFMQTKISHALDNNRNGVWRELRNLGLLPKQQVELHGMEPDISFRIFSLEIKFCTNVSPTGVGKNLSNSVFGQ